MPGGVSLGIVEAVAVASGSTGLVVVSNIKHHSNVLVCCEVSLVLCFCCGRVVHER